MLCGALDNEKGSNKKKAIKIYYYLKNKNQYVLESKVFKNIMESFAEKQPINFILIMNQYGDLEVS